MGVGRAPSRLWQPQITSKQFILQCAGQITRPTLVWKDTGIEQSRASTFPGKCWRSCAPIPASEASRDAPRAPKASQRTDATFRRRSCSSDDLARTEFSRRIGSSRLQESLKFYERKTPPRTRGFSRTATTA